MYYLDKICKIIFNKREKESYYVEKDYYKSGSDSRPPPRLAWCLGFKDFSFIYPHEVPETRQQIKNAGRLYQADRKVDEPLKRVQGDKDASKAHSKELNVLTSYRLNDFKKKADATSDSLRCAAFTLAEVLITLGIIGIVAAMTIPTLINNFQAKQYETKLKQAYTLTTNAISYLHSQDIWVYGKTWTGNDISFAKEKTFVYNFSLAFKNMYTKNSTNKNMAIVSNDELLTAYKTLLGTTTFAGRLLDDGSFQLNNGMTILCETGSESKSPIISIDLNGIFNKPNRMGIDTFAFIIGKNDIVYPLGHPEAPKYNNADLYCNYETDNEYNGFTCAYKAMNTKDYFKNLPK